MGCVGSEQERIISRAAKMEKIEKQSLQHAVNSARQATETIKHCRIKWQYQILATVREASLFYFCYVTGGRPWKVNNQLHAVDDSGI